MRRAPLVVAGALVIALVVQLLPVAGPLGPSPALAAVPFNPCDGIVLSGPDGRYVNRTLTIHQIGGTGAAAVCRLEQQVLANMAAQRGVPYTLEEQYRLMSWARDDVRGELYKEFLRIISTPAAGRTADEQAAYGWLQQRVRNLRLAMAKRSRDEYKKWDQNRCGYVPPAGFSYDPSCGSGLLTLFTGPPDPPTYNDFVTFGTVATLDHFKTDSVGEINARAARAAQVAISTVSAGALTAGIGATAAGIAALLGAKMSLILPFATTGFAFGIGGILGPLAIAVFAVVIAVVRGVQIDQNSKIPGQLEADVTAAQALPNLVDFVSNEAGQGTVWAAFLDATLPDYPDPSFKPAAPGAPTDDEGLILTGGIDPAPHRVGSFRYFDGDGQIYDAWIEDGWWVIDPFSGAGANRMQLALTYVEHDMKLRSATIRNGKVVVLNHSVVEGGTGCEAPACEITDTLRFWTPGVDPFQPTKATVRLPGAPPQFTVGPQTSGNLTDGEEVTLSATAVPEGGVGDVSYRWRVARSSFSGDGTTVEFFYDGQSVNHTFYGGGPYTIEVTATDDDGDRATASLNVNVTSTPIDMAVRQGLVRNASEAGNPWRPWVEGSTQGFLIVTGVPDGTTVKVDWDMDGTYDDQQTSTELFGITFNQVAYPNEGIYPARFQATAPDESVSEAVFGMEVINAPPSAEAQIWLDGSWQEFEQDLPGTPEFLEGVTVQTRYRVTDPGESDTVTAYIRWSDGSFETFSNLETDVWHEVSHTYRRSGYSILGMEVDAVDDAGAFISPLINRGRVFYRVYNVDPEVSNVVVDIDPEGLVTFSANYSDPGDDIESVQIDWGDGSAIEEFALPMALPPTDPLAPGEVPVSVISIDEIVASHLYATDGSYELKYRVFDEVTFSPAWQSTVVDVLNRRPSVDDISTLEVQDGLFFRLGVEASDPDAGDPPSSLTVEIDWGDGLVSNATYDSDSGQFLAEHTYVSPTKKVVTVVAIDDGGLRSDAVVGSVDVGDYVFDWADPILDRPALNRVRAGTVLTVRFSLEGGDEAGALHNQPRHRRTTCATDKPLTREVYTRISNVSYNATTGVYSFKWRTNPAWAGTCRRLVVRLNDGTRRWALFRFTAPVSAQVAPPDLALAVERAAQAVDVARAEHEAR